MPYLSEHAVRLQEPERYTRFRREPDKFGQGIDAIWGITADGVVELQALRFDATRYTIEDVQQFVAEHNLQPLKIEPAQERSNDPAENAERQPTLIERVARLFRAGFYPSKNVEVSENDLDKIIANSKDVPIVVEHKPTLLLGMVKELYRKGKELWGTLWLKPEAAALLEDSEARSLSVAIDLNSMQLHEVSVVKSPQVADAHIFTGTETVSDIAMATQEMPMEKQEHTQEYSQQPLQETQNLSIEQFRQELQQRDARIAQLEDELLQHKVERTIHALFEQGHLIPANRELAHTILHNLLKHKQIVQFNDEPVDLAQLFLQFAQSIPAPVEANAKLSKIANVPEPLQPYWQDLQRFGISNDAMNLLAREIMQEGKNG